MTDDRTMQLLLSVGLLILVLSSLLRRPVRFFQGALMALSWVAIFGLGFLVFSYGGDISAVTRQLSGRPLVEGTTVRIPMGIDGHFWVDAKINGETARLLVDSGATVTSLSSDVAQRVGIDPKGGIAVPVRTANGTVTARRTRADTVAIETIRMEDVGVLVSDGFGVDGVIGMNFLSRLKRWGVESRTLVLEP